MAYEPINSNRLGQLLGANLNTTADQPIAIGLAGSTYVIDRIVITNASASLSLAAGGFYTAASKGGVAIVAAGQVYSSLTGAGKVLAATIAVPDTRTEATIYFALTVAQGGAATADIYIFGTVLS